MTKPTTDQAILEQRILDYLQENGQTPALTISADLDTNPLDTLDALERLQKQGQVGYLKYPRRFPQSMFSMS